MYMKSNHVWERERGLILCIWDIWYTHTHTQNYACLWKRNLMYICASDLIACEI